MPATAPPLTLGLGPLLVQEFVQMMVKVDAKAGLTNKSFRADLNPYKAARVTGLA